MDVNNQINQVVVGGNDGSAFIAWQDYRNGTNYNIYAQRANGVIYAWLDKRNEPAAGIHDIYTLGTTAPEEYTFSITSHGENDLLGPDLNAEIYFNGSPFAIPVYTGYVFGAPGNLPFLSGVYSVVKAGWTGWLPPSVTIVADHNDTQDFLAHVDTLPVELSSFSAVLTAQNFVKLTWVSQSETNLLGYLVYRALLPPSQKTSCQ